ncbi:ribonuclease H-like domain-containing protein [Candidatus Micrarchaeota archaeon]|nr:ribonuclease H-like domain-containing protein [Candidatus Micrarchaeota archaeon]
MRAWLLDVDYVHAKRALRLLLKANGKTVRAYDSFQPYFYLLPKDPASAEDAVRSASAVKDGEVVKIQDVSWVEKSFYGKKVHLLRLGVAHPGLVPPLSDAVKHLGSCLENNILFTRRYLIDKGLVPGDQVDVTLKDKWVQSIARVPAVGLPDWNVLSFDIETYNPSGMPDARKDPMIMVSYADDGESKVLTYSPRTEAFCESLESEKAVLERFSKVLREKKVDVLCTYNGDVFDLPYVRERIQRVGANAPLGRDVMPPKSKKLGLREVTRLGGRIHFDVYNTMYFLNYIGAVRLQRLTLEKTYEGLLGKTKVDFPKNQIVAAWDQKGKLLDDLIEYSRQDAVACLELAQYALPLFVAMGRVTGLTLLDASRFTAGQLVEALLMRKSFQRNEVVPPKPTPEEVASRTAEPIQGAFVKLPQPGLYEDLAVFDFKSLYPSIIISHNIDPSTLNCTCCRDPHVSPLGHRFCRKRQGLIPAMLDEVLATRFALQAEMRNHAKDSPKYKELYARQWALKILANSTYGVLLYPRFRWFRRECGESVTAFGRQYIQDAIAQAEKTGFDVLYSDTDSVFLKYSGKTRDDVLSFATSYNATLPERMQLELEDFYPRGIFVSKKQEEKGAKKKYALINEQGAIKIRGFELVRRDWSRVARDTQRKVLEILLKEGDVPKAMALVRDVICDLKDGKTPLEDCVIWTQLRKKVSSYEIQSPEVSAVISARKEGLDIPEGALVGYVVTRQGKSISEKAQVQELAKDYDADYYVNHQVSPAVLKIVGALGYDKDSIKLKGQQTSLGSW